MPTTNDFKPFSTGGGANVDTQSEYLARPERTAGMQTGIAASKLFNKVWRQAAFMAAVIGEYIMAKLSADVLDDGDLAGKVAQLEAALQAQIDASLPAAVELLSSFTVSSPQATVDIAIPGGFSHYMLRMDGVRPATDGAFPWLRVSEDAGVSFKAGGTDYAYANTGADTGGTGIGGFSGGDSKILLSDTSTGINNTSGGSQFSGTLTIYNPAGTSRNKHIMGDTGFAISSSVWHLLQTMGIFKLDTNAINALRFMMSTGNVSAGTFKLYGIP